MRRTILLLVTVTVVLAWLFNAGRWLVVADPLPPAADAIVVLAGSIPDRVLEAADLYAGGVAPRIVLTRERARPAAAVLARRGVVLPEGHEIAAAALTGLGVPAAAVVTLDARTVSTTDEAAAIAAWACGGEARRLVVVTSPSHTRRARAILRRTLGPSVDVAVRPADMAGFPAARWWRSRWAARTVLFEWEKLVSWWVVEAWRVRPCEAVSRPPPS